MRVVSVSLTEDRYKELQEFAKADHRSISNLVSLFLDQGVNTLRSSFLPKGVNTRRPSSSKAKRKAVAA